MSKYVMDKDGLICSYDKMGREHSYNDQPAFVEIYEENKILLIWFKHGMIHRDNDKPAWVRNDVSIWYKDGVPHRNNGKPAKIWINGYVEHWVNGKFLRFDGKK